MRGFYGTMVRCNLTIGIFVLFLLASAMPVQAVDDDTYKIIPYKMSKMKSITIKENGEWLGDDNIYETPEICRAFKLKETDVRKYFRFGHRVSFRDYLEYLNSSQCYAAGNIVFENGDKGTWFIDRFGRGRIRLEDGQSLYWHCPKCRWHPFSL